MNSVKTKGIELSKELRAIIEQIRKEVKGEEIKLTVDGRIDINATIQANQTLHEFLQKLPINMIVIGLTAAKQGLNPASLIASLGNSYYSKFNGFAGAVTVQKSSGFERLDESALNSVKNWRFVPAKKGDQNIVSCVLVPIVFSLNS